ncbi:MAG: DUF2442 domain-containing protein [Oxalobacteraceae bacterium]|nr:MAG: DUF2442 domain-containing protein [Oxalobacteraceae bacterium]
MAFSENSDAGADPMIKLVRTAVVGNDALQLIFSDGTNALWSAADLIARNTVMTRPLADSAYFARAFIESGALAWPNGLELSADSLHRRLGLTDEQALSAA